MTWWRPAGGHGFAAQTVHDDTAGPPDGPAGAGLVWPDVCPARCGPVWRLGGEVCGCILPVGHVERGDGPFGSDHLCSCGAWFADQAGDDADTGGMAVDSPDLGGGEHAGAADLDDTSRCPVDRRCAGCGGEGRLAVATVETPAGVHCQTLCRVCADVSAVAVPASWGAAVEATIAHCGHLGIDVDQMAALLHAERDTRGQPD